MKDQKAEINLHSNAKVPLIPDKLYFTIGEVSKLCDLKTHVLRYWEQEFTQLSPSKRRGNRRYYQRKDVLLIHQIKALLYDQGFTIEGARAQLEAQKVAVNPPVHYLDAVQGAIKELTDLIVELEK